MIKGFCSYRFRPEESWVPALCEPVTILSYDGDKRFRIRYEDGTEDEVKGYWLRRDRDGDKYIKRIHKHILEGKKRETFNVVTRKTEFHVWSSQHQSVRGPVFDTRKKAIDAALRIARELNCEIEISIERTQINNSCYSSGPLNRFGLYVSPDGFVWTYVWRPGMPQGFIKYMRGYGKINPKSPQQLRGFKYFKGQT